MKIQPISGYEVGITPDERKALQTAEKIFHFIAHHLERIDLCRLADKIVYHDGGQQPVIQEILSEDNFELEESLREIGDLCFILSDILGTEDDDK